MMKAKQHTMKQLFLVIMSALFFSASQAQSKQETAVANAVEQLRQAMIDPTEAKLSRLVMPELSYGHSGGKLEDKATFIQTLVSGKSDFVTIDLLDQTIAVVGKTAIVRHLLKATTNDGGNPGQVQLRILLVWQKTKAGWQLLARQAVKAS